MTSIQLVNDDGTKTELEDGMTLHSDKLRFFVTYHDSEETDPYATGVESAYFYFDGTYRGKYDCDILGSTSGLMHFGNGLHSITFYLKDGYGNVTRETRYFTVEAEKPDVPNIVLNTLDVPTVGKTWQLALESDDPASVTSLTAAISVTRSYPVANVTFPEGVTGSWSYDPSKGVVSVEITTIDHAKYTAGALATVDIPSPPPSQRGSSINVQVTKGSYGCKQTENLDISDLNQYATGFTTAVANYPIEAMYRITAETAVAGSKATATVTVVRDGAAAAGVNVYANDVLQGQTDGNGRIDISGLTASEGSVNLRAEDAEGNCSYQITLFSYNAVGDETGAPYNIIYALSPAADGKTITWMSDPRHSAAAAVVELSTSADLSEATQIEGHEPPDLLLRQQADQPREWRDAERPHHRRDVLLPRRRRHSLVRHPQLHRPGSREADPLLPAGGHSRRRPPLRAWSASPIIWPGSIPSAFSSATPWTMSATTTSGTTP